MPIYFFDIRDEQGVHRDDVGVQLPDFETAVAEARRTLGEMSREALSRGDDPAIEILVRDHGEGPVRLVLTTITERKPNGAST